MSYNRKITPGERRKYWTYAVVRGHDVAGLFDMLRYDGAEFVHVQGGNVGSKIASMLCDHEDEGFLVRRSSDEANECGWTDRRWESFGWRLYRITEMAATEIEYGRLSTNDARFTGQPIGVPH